MDARITAADKLRALPEGSFLTLEKLSTGGSLQARRLSSAAVQFYWRYSHEGRTHREPFGLYDASSPPKKLEPTARGFSLAAARERCRTLAAAHGANRNAGGLREVKAKERREHVEAKAAAEAKAERTLGRLLDDYVGHLGAQGRRSAREAQGIFDLHVSRAWPTAAAMPADEVTQDQVLDMLRLLVQAGKGRTANKLRTYLRAAYQCAIDVRVTATIPIAFKAYAVTINPVAQTKRDARFDRADKRPLDLDEMRTYWRLIEKEQGMRGRCLRLHLLTGAQRIDQLVRLRWADVRADTITIYDAKGRPSQGARTHTVPLIRAAAREVQAFAREGDFVLSSTAGRKPISGTTLAGWAKAAVDDAIDEFQLKRVRSGVETLLAARGVSREVRGHLQSHGLTGIQARHYDGHDYAQEKLSALETLLAALTAKGSKQRDKAPAAKRASARSARPVGGHAGREAR